MDVLFIKAISADGPMLADIRVAAMRQSLEAAGRFDPNRARNRFLEGFDPSATYKIVTKGVVVGVFVLKDRTDNIHLDHLYLTDTLQGRGVGGKVIAFSKSYANELSLPLQLSALNGSKANDFYLKHGFEITRIDEFDTYYEYKQKP